MFDEHDFDDDEFSGGVFSQEIDGAEPVPTSGWVIEESEPAQLMVANLSFRTKTVGLKWAEPAGECCFAARLTGH